MFWIHNRRSSSAELHCNLTFSSHQLFTALNAAISISLEQQEEKDEDVNYSGAGQSERPLRDHQHYSNTHTHTCVYTRQTAVTHTDETRAVCEVFPAVVLCQTAVSTEARNKHMCVCPDPCLEQMRFLQIQTLIRHHQVIQVSNWSTTHPSLSKTQEHNDSARPIWCTIIQHV